MAKKEEKPSGDRKISVIAIGDHFGKQTGEVVGYYNHCRVRVGQKFWVKESDFSKRWMERLGEHETRTMKEKEADLESDANRANSSPYRDTDLVI